VKETGLRNSAYGADQFGFSDLAAVHWNLAEAPLYEHALANHELQAIELFAWAVLAFPDTPIAFRRGLIAILFSIYSGKTAEEIGTQERRDHRAVAAGGLALDTAVLTRRERGKVRVDVRDDLVAEVRVVVADSP